MLKSLKVIYLLSVVLFCSSVQATGAGAGGVVLAKYKGGEVTAAQIEQEFRAMLDSQEATKGKTFAQLDKNVQDALLRAFLNAVVLQKEAQGLKLESDPSFQDKLENSRKQLVQSEVLQRYIADAINEKMIDQEYEALVQNLKGQKQVEVSHILVVSKEDAEKVKKEIAAGQKFSDVAKKYSKDEASAKNGGKIGYILRDQVPAEFAKEAFSLNKGQVSAPFQTQFGWHIIQVHGDQPATPPTKADAKPGLLANLNKSAVEAYLKKLYEKFDVKIEADTSKGKGGSEESKGAEKE
ncbi:Parvulin-like PPIase [Rickettsiales endosymbiont of Paramecium tredecaurelia]|uniref:peptidylprolyl isomerase n=1 Tax=Candidatus Sarmatiella mevalonica TaxID=2770581 RepID=UPI0019246AFC|nr:peptidylprolyl isomerase [Candidatus Sarmatiella mevalonica]MBL3284456.1 Parvulin-like PPIase [Candidatus Sarmatiella mevalonica]